MVLLGASLYGGHPFFVTIYEVDVLDLHGTFHDEVEFKLHRFIYRCELPCKIITGKSPRMKEIVKNAIQEYDLKWHYENYINYGCLIVTEK